MVFAILFAVAWPVVFGTRTRRGVVAGGLVVVFLLHWQLEGLRWQMIPLYLTALGLAAGDVLVVERRLDWVHRISRGVFGVAGVGLAFLLPLAFPVPRLPAPSGPESIGTVSVELVDREREEVYGPRPGGPRRLMTQIWYPARPVEGVDPVTWSEDWDVVSTAVALRLGLPSWFLGYTGYVDSHARPSLPAAAGSYPVVVYSHGWTGFRTIAINQIENLVSNGYVVVAIDHTYAAVAIRFPDGEVIGYDPAALPEVEEVGEEEYDKAAETLVEVLAADIGTVLTALEQGREGPFGEAAGIADVTRVGVYGYGAGGGAAVRFCLEDERCDAMLGLDAWVEPIPDRILSVSATRPALYMRSDGWRDTENDGVLRGIAERSEAVTYWIGVEGAGHNDFVATPLLSPIADRLGLKGPIPAGRVVPIIDRYLLGFFDVFLLGTGPAALETPSFPEVSLEVIRPD